MMYRFKALAKRRDPDQLDGPLTLASPSGWTVTLVIGFCMLALIGWGIFGRVPQLVAADGRLQYPGGLVTIHSDAAGTVSGMASLGERLDRNGALATLRSNEDGGDVQVHGATEGRVVQHLVEVGDVVEVGTPLAVVEPGAGDMPLEAVVEVASWQVEAVRPGQDVKLTVSGVTATKYGLLRGRIDSLAPFPTSTGGAQVGPTLVTISLERADTTTGYAWTSPNGPDHPIESQTPVTAEIDTGDASPLELLGG